MKSWMKKLIFIYLFVVVVVHVVPLGDDLDLTVNNSYIIEDLRLDHLLHGLIFVPVYFFIWSLIHSEHRWQRFIIALLLCTLFAVLAESLQILLSYRAFTVPDLLSNLFGVGVGLIFFSTLVSLRVIKP